MVERAVSPRNNGARSQQMIQKAVESINNANEAACRRIMGQSPQKLEIPDRRGSGRNQISVPFYLFPAFSPGNDFSPRSQQALIAVTRDMSSRGVGFRCDREIPLGNAMAEFDGYRSGRIRLMLEIRWRRRQSLHCYLAGARIVDVLSPDEFSFPV